MTPVRRGHSDVSYPDCRSGGVYGRPEQLNFDGGQRLSDYGLPDETSS